MIMHLSQYSTKYFWMGIVPTWQFFGQNICVLVVMPTAKLILEQWYWCYKLYWLVTTANSITMPSTAMAWTTISRMAGPAARHTEEASSLSFPLNCYQVGYLESHI
jgi:hypothetical protein